MTNNNDLNKLMKKGQDFLGCEYPVICGAMTWVSEPKLVAAVCNAGGFASLAGGNAPGDILKAQVEETKSLTDKPFGVNLITIAPAYKEHLKIIKELEVPVVIFAGSFPKQKEVEIAKEAGAKVMCFASTESIANRMLRFGADAIILEGSEAGGHIGHVSLTVLLQQVLLKVRGKIPVFVAGGIARGEMMAQLLMMGASGVQMGTRFVMAEECIAHDKFKDVFIRANARDAIATPQYDSKLPVVAVRALKNKGMAEFGRLQLALLKELDAGEINREEAQIKVEEFWMGALRKAAIDGNVVEGSLMAGQSVGLMHDIKNVNDIFADLLAEASTEIERVKALFV